MPIYEYECSSCKIVIERIRPLDCMTIECHCGHMSNRIMSLCAGRVVNGTPKLTSTKTDKNITKSCN